MYVNSGVRGRGASTPQKFWFVKNPGIENLGKNGTQHCFIFKNGTQRVQKNTLRHIFGSNTRKGLHDLCGRKFVGKSHTKTFQANLGNSGKNLHTPKILSAPPMHTNHCYKTLQSHIRLRW